MLGWLDEEAEKWGISWINRSLAINLSVTIFTRLWLFLLLPYSTTLCKFLMISITSLFLPVRRSISAFHTESNEICRRWCFFLLSFDDDLQSMPFAIVKFDKCDRHDMNSIMEVVCAHFVCCAKRINCGSSLAWWTNYDSAKIKKDTLAEKHLYRLYRTKNLQKARESRRI